MTYIMRIKYVVNYVKKSNWISQNFGGSSVATLKVYLGNKFETTF